MDQQHPNAELIRSFYTAFQKLDAETMAQCYAEQVHFSDPVFTDLHGVDAVNMWRMLCSRALDFHLHFDDVAADDHHGRAHWVATYTFAQTGRQVVNDIAAKFEFADGKIVRHQDHFDLWKWSRQALGVPGLVLGWTPLIQNKIRAQAAKGLRAFTQSR
ncbi:nuclear transport factor 2 family protein [Undibacterium cyanobacteriorum]|uniref:Nuclear transport factor 2 family protein n=1 Tax=Undibacterium cyanobacteriorum TaxID=3073561 RepID=A0ABY9RK15_9BURK|nr:nuclear transport factor 2 family protein [Undibacterium sp. 20NA77.5]WMW81000.1 nuclear transport factor 2 family protein [Undibacterium sp. 20NA77.5]